MERSAVLRAIVETIVEDDGRALFGGDLEVELGEARAAARLPLRHVDQVDEEGHLPVKESRGG